MKSLDDLEVVMSSGLAGAGTIGGQRVGVVDRVVEQLEQAITSGRLALGQRLVEPDLMQEFGASRGSIREALNRLSAAGYVELLPNRGALVRRLSRKEVGDRYLIRVRLEGLAAAQAAQSLDQGDGRARLFALMAESSRLTTPEDYREHNYRLHGLIAELSANPQLATFIRQLWLPGFMVELRALLDMDYRLSSAEDHRRIAAAILAQDSEAAEAAMRAHLEARSEMILSLPERVFGRQVP
jgi:DNA-binding GntR family transcriptional regulator